MASMVARAVTDAARGGPSARRRARRAHRRCVGVRRSRSLEADEPSADHGRDWTIQRLADSAPPALALPTFVTFVARARTWTGNGAFLALVVAAAVLLLWRRNLVTDAVFVLLAFAGAEVITFGMKQGFRRDRPFFEDPLATASSFSFPSGHALVSLAVYGSLALVVARHASSRRLAAAVLAIAAIWILAIGFSRLYLGVHFLSDVLAGYAAGAAWLALLYVAIEVRGRYTSRYRASASEYSPNAKRPAATSAEQEGPVGSPRGDLAERVRRGRDASFGCRTGTRPATRKTPTSANTTPRATIPHRPDHR